MAKLSDDRFSEWFERLWDAAVVLDEEFSEWFERLWDAAVVLDEETSRCVLSDLESHGFQRAIRALRERAKQGPRNVGKHYDFAADYLEQLEKSDGQ